jgi:hypothetical protein
MAAAAGGPAASGAGAAGAAASAGAAAASAAADPSMLGGHDKPVDPNAIYHPDSKEYVVG